MGLSDAERRRLLLIARGAVAARLGDPTAEAATETGDPDALRRRAQAIVERMEREATGPTLSAG